MKKKMILISAVLIVAVMSLVTLSFAGESKNGKTSLRLENSIHNTDTDYNYDSDDLSVRMLYDQKNGYVYLVDGLNGTITSVQAENKRTGEETDVELISQENDPSFVYGNIASAVLSPDGSMLAASPESMKSESQGRIILFECEEEGNLKYIGMAPAGVLTRYDCFQRGQLYGADGRSRQFTVGGKSRGKYEGQCNSCRYSSDEETDIKFFR